MNGVGSAAGEPGFERFAPRDSECRASSRSIFSFPNDVSSLYGGPVRSTIGDDLQARLEALAARIEAAMVRVAERSTPPSLGDSDALIAELRDAEARAQLQAQRCQALEDRIVELEAALVGARAARVDDTPDTTPAQTRQTKLLEVERLTSELVELRRSNEEWRGRARSSRRELELATGKLERATTQLSELRAREEANGKRLGELERIIAEQRRELDSVARRANHRPE